MADEEPTPYAEPPPGWSNAAADGGISTHEPPAVPVDMTQAGWSNNGPAATGATAGIPGTFTPAGCDSPDKFAEMTGIVATPATAWTSGQYVLLGDGTFAYWNASTWVVGKKP